MKVYCAGPFFNESQLETMKRVEAVVTRLGYEVFRPRDGAAAAKKLNKDIGAGKDPSRETRRRVFDDNVENIDDAALVVAVIDGRDIGTIWEMGYAYARNVPVMTYTDNDFGLNLMLAESVLAHCKGEQQLEEALSIFFAAYAPPDDVNNLFEVKFKCANLEETKKADKNSPLYKKGADE